MYLETRDAQRRANVVHLIELVFRDLEISDARFAMVKARYETIGAWLAASKDPMLHGLVVYLQGSTAIGTTIKPIGSEEHDVDLVSRLIVGSSTPPGAVKKAIGDRLKESPNYAPLLEEMSRCWRLNYANEFHMDITPSILNPTCHQGGELVPDKPARIWKPSNPMGYRKRFLDRAALKPQFRVTKQFHSDARAGTIEAFPERSRLKNILQRAVQMGKRHRDVHFDQRKLDLSLRPISVIITTLAAWSYEHCVKNYTYDDELQLLCDVIAHMPDFIDERVVGGQRQWYIWNESTTGENFAEKWNRHPERAEAFFAWHRVALNEIRMLTQFEGLDGLSIRLQDAFGKAPAQRALRIMTDEVNELRRRRGLAVAPRVGLISGASAAAAATPVAANTFFGRDE